MQSLKASRPWFVGVDVVMVADCRRLVGLIIRGVRGGRLFVSFAKKIRLTPATQ